jgi:heme-degrading monooxygenase HmoA
MILEAVVLPVIADKTAEFEATFPQAVVHITGAKGYIRHELRRGIEVPNKYLLLIYWETLDDHMIGFRQSEAYQEWRALLHHFYDPFPTVEHFEAINLSPE